ncbi:MAG: hypothetical protein OEW08_08285 [Gammaproteobacteria bacterium]|nr:hypothetical protein [Gammaproteobacteria bacterium]
MEKYKISQPMRFFFFVASSFLWLGLWFTGFGNAHFLLYIPAVFFAFAVVTGICPGLIVSNLLFGKKSSS